MEISTSILSIKNDAVKRFYDLEVAKTDYFHIDVMDGIFVENNTADVMLEYATTLNHITNIGLDVHLMCENVELFIDEYIDLEPDSISFHIEAIKDKDRITNIINEIKSNNIKVGLAINPKTDITTIYEFLPFIHKIIVMTVEPGKGGQELIKSTIDKIRILKKYIDDNGLETVIEADGGINDNNINELKDAGVEIAVAGAYIINSSNYIESIKKLK